MSTKTEQMPNGDLPDLLGASLAAMGIGNVHLLRHDLELARPSRGFRKKHRHADFF
jgi:hypothetical protein